MLDFNKKQWMEMPLYEKIFRILGSIIFLVLVFGIPAIALKDILPHWSQSLDIFFRR